MRQRSCKPDSNALVDGERLSAGMLDKIYEKSGKIKARKRKIMEEVFDDDDKT